MPMPLNCPQPPLRNIQISLCPHFPDNNNKLKSKLMAEVEIHFFSCYGCLVQTYRLFSLLFQQILKQGNDGITHRSKPVLPNCIGGNGKVVVPFRSNSDMANHYPIEVDHPIGFT